MKRAGLTKNTLLVITFVLSMAHKFFSEWDMRVDWYLFIDKTRRIDFAVMYYCNTINFLILAYCLHYKEGVDQRITRFILIVTSLDMVHQITLSKQGFGMAKIGVAILIYYVWKYKLDNKNG